MSNPMKVFKKADKIKLTGDEYLEHLQRIDDFQVELDVVKYNPKLFEGYDRIVVLGPQRSGTTFTAQAISNTLGKDWHFIDEGGFQSKNTKTFRGLWKRDHHVFQAPGLTHLIHEYAGKNDLVVFMVRRWSDILRSVKRISKGGPTTWTLMDTVYDMNKYHYRFVGEEFYDKHVDRNSYFLDVIYKMWKHYQTKLIPNYINLDYESMCKHPKWIDKLDRQNFSPKQTKKKKK